MTAGIEASMKAYDDAMKESGDFQAFLKKREDALSPDKKGQLDALRKKHADNADHRDGTHTALGQALEDTIPGLGTLDTWLSKLWGSPEEKKGVRSSHGGKGKYLYDHVAPLRGLDNFINGGGGKAAWDRGNGAPDPSLSGRSIGQQLGDYGNLLANGWRHVKDAWANEQVGGADLLDLGPKGRQTAAMRYFVGQGWTHTQAAGPTANVGAESGFNPFKSGDHGHAYGLGQWQGPRQRDYAKLFGHTMQSVKNFTQAFSEQLEFYQHELTKGTDAGARKAGRLLSQATSGYDAGAIVSMFDERPNARDEAARNRGNSAELLAQNGTGNDGKVQVDTRIRITHEGVRTTSASTRSEGSARAGTPKIEMAMVLA